MSRILRNSRNINGVLLLDKDLNISSNKVLQEVKSIYNAKKAGHTGTLDPLAEGMLPICFGESTKFAQFLLNAKKRYIVIARLGQKTSTADSTGKLIKECSVNFSQIQLDEALSQFRGNICQIPSMYSAIKNHGKPLYKYARQGLEVPRKARNITIYHLRCIRYQDNELELEIDCSKGTYIRTVIDDLGTLLGCGAHVIYLRRIQVSQYSSDLMVTLKSLQQIVTLAQEINIEQSIMLDSLLLPIDAAASHLPEVNITDIFATHIIQGKGVQIQAICLPTEGMVRINAGNKRKFIGVGNLDNQGYLTPYRLVSNIY
ncbi:tRNA pseudouridine(55) synthase TruB [Candidatus Profftia sp. (ex Adelges kitamiensis)]|uniref:tRNA pseudouridine(55) synthase TruB n=1 Tax=Candidatus Profftia sp. (ex Adelges kitamiensis) TaxID=2864218 RepID=UPI001CE2B4AC|nr:tRNA pseudouridine(55) synthase TruB [Candidatus Profftia sp. (ex Adelges kitamiensis)]